MVIATELLIIQLGLLVGYSLATFLVPDLLSSIPKASLCHKCDDTVPGKECSTSTEDKICKGKTPFCLTTIIGAATMTVVKSCASRSTCHDVWWQKTKPDPSCGRSAVENGHLSPGVTCSYCCSGIRCNTHLYPVHLLRYTDQPTVATTRATTPSTTASTTTVTTTATTTAQITTKKHHHQSIPKASMCLTCEDNPARGIKCDETSQFAVCNASHPFCLTSYTSINGSYVIKRGCATKQTCYARWWMASRLNADCLREDLLNRTSRDHLECHYCCRAPDHKHAFCNKFSSVLLPENIALFNSTVVGHRCEVTGNDVKDRIKSKFQQCGDSTPYCLNTVIRRPNGKNTILKRCASEAECFSMWWSYTRNQRRCVDLSAVDVGVHGLSCQYCCDSSATGTVCNIHDVPTYTMSFKDKVPTTQATTTKHLTSPPITKSTMATTKLTMTTTKSTMATPKSTNATTKSTMATTKSTMATPKSTMATTKSTMATPKSTMATPKSTMATTKSTMATTKSTMTTPKSTMTIPKSTMTTPKSTMTTLKSTMTTTKSTIPTSSFKTTTISAGPQCQVCEDDPITGKVCSMSDVVACPDEEPFCKNSYIITAHYTKRIIKRCASDSECYLDWWSNTRHNDQCMHHLGAPTVSGHGLICRFCCKSGSSNVCNLGVVPKNLLQYDLPTTTKASPPNTKKGSTFVTSSVSKSTKPNTASTATTVSTVTPMDTNSSSTPTTRVIKSTTPNTKASTAARTVSTVTPLDTKSSSTPIKHVIKTTTPNSRTATNGSTVTPLGTKSLSTPTKHVIKTTTPNSRTATTATTVSTARPRETTLSSTPTTTVIETKTPSTTATMTANATTASKTTHTTHTQCYVCEHGCPFAQRKHDCTSGYCLTTVTDDDQYTRTIQKRCVDRQECYTKWWLQTSDNDGCLALLTMAGIPSGMNLQCDYCCHGDDCNQDDFPPHDTLFDPSQS